MPFYGGRLSQGKKNLIFPGKIFARQIRVYEWERSFGPFIRVFTRAFEVAEDGIRSVRAPETPKIEAPIEARSLWRPHFR